MVRKRPTETAPKKKSNLKGRQLVDTVTIPVVYETDDAFVENGVTYLAEELVAKSVASTKDTLLVHRYRMAVRRGKFNTITRYGVLFIDTTAPLASNSTVLFKFKGVTSKKAAPMSKASVKKASQNAL